MPGSPQGRVRMSESVCAKKLDRLGRNPLQTEKVFYHDPIPALAAMTKPASQPSHSQDTIVYLEAGLTSG